MVKELVKFLDESPTAFGAVNSIVKMLKEKGYKILSINDVKFIHYESKTIGKTLSYYKKMNQLYKSKIYYHKKYNKINFLQIFIFQILNICKKLELFIEIPMRKLLKK